MKELRKEMLKNGFDIVKNNIYNGDKIYINGEKYIGRYLETNKQFHILVKNWEDFEYLLNKWFEKNNLKIIVNDEYKEKFKDWNDYYIVYIYKVNVVLYKGGLLWIM